MLNKLEAHVPDLPKYLSLLEKSDTITSFYAVGRKPGSTYAFLGVNFSADHDPAFAQALTTSVTRSIGTHMLTAVPASLTAGDLLVFLNHGQNSSVYQVPPGDVGQFDAAKIKHFLY